MLQRGRRCEDGIRVPQRAVHAHVRSQSHRRHFCRVRFRFLPQTPPTTFLLKVSTRAEMDDTPVFGEVEAGEGRRAAADSP